MALGRKLFVNWHTKRRQKSASSSAPDSVDRLVFYKRETVPFQVVILEPDPDGGLNAFTRVDITDLTLRMAINDTSDDDATPLVEQSTWTKDEETNTFIGELPLNVAAFNSYLAADKTPYFEIELLSASSRVKILSELCEAKVGVLTTTTTSPDPLSEYYTIQQLRGIFVPYVLPPGKTITIPSQDSNSQRILGCNNDGTAQDDIV
jgi:hypothetical protein